MPASYLLDTNAYFLFLHHPRPSHYFRLVKTIKVGDMASFYISEITSMEIHSVLGKYRRGSQPQRQQCEREVITDGKIVTCSNTWIHRGRKRMKPKVFRDFQKLISDIETRRGNTQATILELDYASIQEARELLMKYADRYSLGSHDALIAGSLIAARDVKRLNLTLVTSDRGLKAVLREEGIPFYDPAIE